MNGFSNPSQCSDVKVQKHVEAGGRQAADQNDEKNQYKSYLVDPASSRMLVSKIKPCM